MALETKGLSPMEITTLRNHLETRKGDEAEEVIKTFAENYGMTVDAVREIARLEDGKRGP